MYGFLIKKAFFDLWDNLWFVLFQNLVVSLIIAVPVGASLLLPAEGFGFGKAAVLLIFVLVLFLWGGVVSATSREITDYKVPLFSSLPGHLRDTATTSLFFAIFSILYSVFFRFAASFYTHLGSTFGLAIFFLLLWLTLFLVLFAQFYFPVRSRLDTKPVQILKKSFLLFIDNPGFSFVLFSGVVILFTLSVFTGFLFPGLGGILIWLNVGLKLRMYKYEYRDSRSNGRVTAVPWEELLVEEKELLGKRSFRSFLFPWKE